MMAEPAKLVVTGKQEVCTPYQLLHTTYGDSRSRDGGRAWREGRDSTTQPNPFPPWIDVRHFSVHVIYVWKYSLRPHFLGRRRGGHGPHPVLRTAWLFSKSQSLGTWFVIIELRCLTRYGERITRGRVRGRAAGTEYIVAVRL